MVALITPQRALLKMADAVRQRRLAIGLTQAGLSSRSGVALGTLRKFERTGLASTEAFVKLLSVVGGLEAVMEATRPANLPFASIDAVLEEPPEALRKRGWRS